MHKKPELFSSAWNIGPDKLKDQITVLDIIKKIKLKNLNIKYKFVKNKFSNEKKLINLSTKKIKKYFNLNTKLSIDQSIDLTIEWFMKEFNKEDTYKITLDQIKQYENYTEK